MAQDIIRIGVSSCLLGEAVRYDGNHKRDPYIHGTLGRYVAFVPVCPEVAIGLGVPRPPIQLTGDPQSPRAVGVRDPELDVTDDLVAYGARMGETLAGLSGYIFKAKSPSCGLERVAVQWPAKPPLKQGVGIYAQAFMAAQPLLPVEEEGRLSDPELRDGFLERMFAYRRWRHLVDEGLTAAKLMDFHSAHKLAVMAHSPQRAKELGRLAAKAGEGPLQEVAQAYALAFMTALRQRATRRRHTNVLQHLAGYLKRQLKSADRRELAAVIEAYRAEQLSLMAPITLLRHHFRRHPDPFVERQTYLYPEPQEALLRNGG